MRMHTVSKCFIDEIHDLGINQEINEDELYNKIKKLDLSQLLIATGRNIIGTAYSGYWPLNKFAQALIKVKNESDLNEARKKTEAIHEDNLCLSLATPELGLDYILKAFNNVTKYCTPDNPIVKDLLNEHDSKMIKRGALLTTSYLGELKHDFGQDYETQIKNLIIKTYNFDVQRNPKQVKLDYFYGNNEQLQLALPFGWCFSSMPVLAYRLNIELPDNKPINDEINKTCKLYTELLKKDYHATGKFTEGDLFRTRAMSYIPTIALPETLKALQKSMLIDGDIIKPENIHENEYTNSVFLLPNNVILRTTLESQETPDFQGKEALYWLNELGIPHKIIRLNNKKNY